MPFLGVGGGGRGPFDEFFQKLLNTVFHCRVAKNKSFDKIMDSIKIIQNLPIDQQYHLWEMNWK